MSLSDGHKDKRYFAARAKALREWGTNPTCHICRGVIDTDLPARHPLSLTADHVEPLAFGGAPDGELRPAHYRCNSSRGGRDSSRVRAQRLRKYSYHEDNPGLKK